MSDTPETDAIVGRHQKEIADLPMNPPIEVALRLSQRHCIELMSLAQNAERQRDALQLKLDSAHRFAERSADAILNAKAERDALKAELAAMRHVLMEVERRGPNLPLGTYLAACRLANAARKP